MENATKVLVIAGSILVTIILISTGILLYKSSSGTFKSADDVSKSMFSKTTEVVFDQIASEQDKFNKYWLSRFGNNKTAGEVRALLTDIYKSNAESGHIILVRVNKADGSERKDAHSGNIQNKLKNIISRYIYEDKTYLVRVTTGCSQSTGGYDKEGYLKCITVQEKN